MVSVLMMFDVEPTFPRSQQLMISNDENDDDDRKVEFSSVRLRFLSSSNPSPTLYLKYSPSVASPTILVNSLQFVIFLDFNRSVDASQSPTLLDI